MRPFDDTPSSRPAWLQHARALIAALALAPLLALAQSDPPGRVGRIAELTGTVWVYDEQDGAWRAAERNLPVTGGDRFATEGDARAELRIGSTTLQLGAGSELELLQLDDDRLRVQLHRGGLALRVVSSEIAAGIEVLTDEGRLLPLRAGHYRFDRIDDTSFAGVWRGELQFQGQDNLRLVGAGERIEFWVDRARGVARTRDAAMPGDRLAAWAVESDRRAQRSAAYRHVSPEMTGVEELDRHGRWEQHPEYGAVWVPRDVAPGWAPYRDGRWVWQRPWGWTWVDAAPWGFAPFHYGRWVSWHGRWTWWPGVYQPRPVFAPALVAWIGGPNVGVSINIGGPRVGWIPLAPYEVYVPHYHVTPIYVDRINRGHDHRGRPGRERPPRQVPTGPIMYTNQGVPGGVTVVSSDVLRSRQPVAPAVVAPPAVVHRTPVTTVAPPVPAPQRQAGPPRHDDVTEVAIPAPRFHGGRDGREPGGRPDRPAPRIDQPVPVMPAAPVVQGPPRHDDVTEVPIPAPRRAEPRERAPQPAFRAESPRQRDREREREQVAPAPRAPEVRERPPMRTPESRQDQRRRDQVQ